MAKRESAGILMYRKCDSSVEVFLVHPGGPYWANKDAGSWSIPKGEFAADEDSLSAAQREFQEETGIRAKGNFIPLNPLKQAGGKLVHAWAVEGDCDARKITSNTFSLEWPPRSGKRQQFPEVDRAEWFPVEVAKEKILKGQAGFLDELQGLLNNDRVNS